MNDSHFLNKSSNYSLLGKLKNIYVKKSNKKQSNKLHLGKMLNEGKKTALVSLNKTDWLFEGECGMENYISQLPMTGMDKSCNYV